MSELRVHTLAERPDLASAFAGMPSTWPEFMFQDPMAWLLGGLEAQLPEHHLIATDGDLAVGIARSVPFDWSGSDDDLPDQGWDEIVGRGHRTHRTGQAASALSALEITVHRDHQRRGVSTLMVAGLRDNARIHGFSHLVAPVRPTQKHLEPYAPMAEYALRTRRDGLPHDAWLRVHVRAGARIVKQCSAAMAIAGSLAQWRRWTGLPFDGEGDVIVAGALVPVRVSMLHDSAVYVEPNVWVHHLL